MDAFFEFIKKHRGVIVGSCLGLVVGVLMLCIGFFGTLFLVLCVGIGAFFGTKNKLRKRLFEILDKILPDLFR